MEGYTELARELDIRIATGENLYTKYAFADLIARKGADVVQPDNRRAGGVTEWLEIAALADDSDFPLTLAGLVGTDDQRGGMARRNCAGFCQRQPLCHRLNGFSRQRGFVDVWTVPREGQLQPLQQFAAVAGGRSKYESRFHGESRQKSQ
jgi:L-alanine-DL-glutamate epimerase-like enolase superfamily enzyme